MATIEILGHRGARGEAPENTLSSFRRAAHAGVHGIELDVRMSSDGTLFTFHDKTLKRTTRQRGALHKLNAAKLSQLDARYGRDHWPTPEPIPTLETVLTQCPSHLHYQLEIKGFMKVGYLFALAEQLSHLITKLNLYPRVVVTSEDPNVLRVMRRINKKITLGYVCQYQHRLPIINSKLLQCDWLIAHYALVSDKLMTRARNKGLKVSCWTVNNLDEAERLALLKVDSIITDYPTAMLAHFQQRTQPLA